MEPNSKKRLLASPKDHLVSGDSFRVMLDRSTQIAQTSPFPSLEQLPAYYQHQAYISHGNANRSFVERMYGYVQRLMFWQKGKWLQPYFSKDSTYLDYGCGTASFVNHLNRKGIDASGVEPNEKARTFHKETKKVVATLNEIEKKSFSVIALWHVLEHIPEPNTILQLLSKKLSPSGALIIALPNFNSKDAQLYKSEWAAYDVPRHLWHFSREGIVGLAAKEGLKCVKVRPLVFDAFYVCYLSEKQRGSRFPLARGFFNGIYSNFHALRTREYSSLVYFFEKLG
ncbi:class I SAM-dependent methyltransferase [Flavobacteriaceae bacterium]|nr:class I SAM-dependent methyltransferase [Flavobacteriaceae bacterium]